MFVAAVLFRHARVKRGTLDGLPNFKSNVHVIRDDFKLGAVTRNQSATDSSRSKRDQHIEMKISQLVGCKTSVGVNARQSLTGF